MLRSVSLVLVVTFSVLFSGCASTGTAGLPKIDPQTMTDAAVVLRTAARGAATVAIESDPKNRQYIQLSVTAMDTFILGQNYAPGELTKALQPVVKQVNDPKIQLAVNTVADLYEIFFNRYIKGKIDQNPTAVQFIQSLRDGAASALDITKSDASPVIFYRGTLYTSLTNYETGAGFIRADASHF